MRGKRTVSATIFLLIESCATGLAAPSAAMRSACAGDRTRLCNSFVGKPSEMQNCMRAHRAEWSAGCAGAAPKGQANAGDGGRRAKCAAYVQWKYLPQNGGSAMEHRHAAPAELRRCMQGEPMD
jgi:hypothetical protein